MADRENIQDLASRTVVAMAAGAGGLVGPDMAAVATTLTPLAEEALTMVVRVVSARRREHAAETLTDAAEAAGVSTEGDFVEFINAALSDERKQEMLARALTVAQDSALRGKRRAIGRSIAAAIGDMGTQVDDELIFLRALDDLNEPHFQLLFMMTEISPVRFDRAIPLNVWTRSMVGITNPGMKDTARSLLTGLERHGLVESNGESYSDFLNSKIKESGYTVTEYGHRFLERFSEVDPG